MGTTEYVCLPGVLARGPEQYAPLYDVLPLQGREFTYAGLKFHPDYEVRRIAAHIDTSTADQIVLIGSSFGGVLLPFVVAALPSKFDQHRLKCVIVDAPFGVDTICDTNARFLANRFFAKAAIGITSFLRLKVPVGDDMLPKASEISNGLDVQELSKTARESLEGHYLSMLLSQTAWMIQVAADGSLAMVCRGLALKGADVTYLACTHPGNGVVLQPEAWSKWQRAILGLKVSTVHGVHCGYLQNQPEFRDVLRRILA